MEEEEKWERKYQERENEVDGQEFVVIGNL